MLLGLVEPIGGDWLSEMVTHALRPEIGAVGAKLYDQAGAIAHAGIILGADGVAGRIYRGTLKNRARTIARLFTVQNYTAVTGACLAARREVIEQVGGIDVEHLPSAYFDIDLCLRLREVGYRTVWTPDAELLWLDADARGDPRADDTAGGRTLVEQEDYLVSRWGDTVRADPNYNPNLSLKPQGGRSCSATEAFGALGGRRLSPTSSSSSAATTEPGSSPTRSRASGARASPGGGS